MFIQQGSIKSIKSDSTDSYHLTKDFYLKKMLFSSAPTYSTVALKATRV